MQNPKQKITVRLSADDFQALQQRAKAMGMETAVLARTYIQDGLNGWDRKHEELVYRLAQLQEDLERNTALSAGAVAASVALLDDGTQSIEDTQAKLRTQTHNAMSIGKSIKQMLDDGKFDGKPA